MRRLIFCWNYLEWGGAQIYFLGIMKLARANWDITVLLPGGSDPKLLGFLDDTGVKYEFLQTVALLGSASTISQKIKRHLSHIRSWIEIYRRLRQYDLRRSILHIEVAPWHAVWLLSMLSLRRANVFITLHNALPDVSVVRRAVWQIKLAVVTRLNGLHILTSNKDAKVRFKPWVNDDFWESVKVTYTTVDPVVIDEVLEKSETKEVIRSRFQLDPKKFTILCVGQFVDRKGRWIFLEAARSVAKSEDDVQFIWLTSSPISDDDHQRVAAYGLGDSFRLMPAEKIGQRREDILRFYRIADAYALPSFVEGLPIALLEAMAMGVASISTNVYAIPEAIENDVTGLLIEPGDAGQLAAAILRLRADVELRRRLAKDGRAFVLANFDERVASRIAIDAYEECFADVG